MEAVAIPFRAQQPVILQPLIVRSQIEPLPLALRPPATILLKLRNLCLRWLCPLLPHLKVAATIGLLLRTLLLTAKVDTIYPLLGRLQAGAARVQLNAKALFKEPAIDPNTPASLTVECAIPNLSLPLDLMTLRQLLLLILRNEQAGWPTSREAEVLGPAETPTSTIGTPTAKANVVPVDLDAEVDLSSVSVFP